MAWRFAITESDGIDRGGLFHKNGASVALVLEGRLVNYSAIYKDFFKWKERRSQEPFQSGRILYDHGVIVIEPFDSPELVMKFLSRKVSRPRSLLTEHKNLLRLASKKISTKKFTLPESVRYNKKPKYLLLTNLGENFKGKDLKRSRISELGTIAGEFAARLYELDGTVHNDLHCGNLTQCPDGRTGIIDAESIRKTVMPEIMLRSPSMQKPPFAMNMARSFMVHSRIELCPFSAWMLTQPEYWPQMKHWMKSKPDFAQKALVMIDNNLGALYLMIEQWKDAKEKLPADLKRKKSSSFIPEISCPKPVELPKKIEVPKAVLALIETTKPHFRTESIVTAASPTQEDPLLMARRILESEQSILDRVGGKFVLNLGRPPEAGSFWEQRVSAVPVSRQRIIRAMKCTNLRQKFDALEL